MSLFVNQVTDEWGTSYSLTGLGYGALVVLMLALLLLACFLRRREKDQDQASRFFGGRHGSGYDHLISEDF